MHALFHNRWIILLVVAVAAVFAVVKFNPSLQGALSSSGRFHHFTPLEAETGISIPRGRYAVLSCAGKGTFPVFTEALQSASNGVSVTVHQYPRRKNQSGSFVYSEKKLQSNPSLRPSSTLTQLERGLRYHVLSLESDLTFKCGVGFDIPGLACVNGVDDDGDSQRDFFPAVELLAGYNEREIQGLAYAESGEAFVLTQLSTAGYDKPATLEKFSSTGMRVRSLDFATVHGQYISIAHHLTAGSEYIALSLMNWSYVDSLLVLRRDSLAQQMLVYTNAEIYGLWFDEHDPTILYVLTYNRSQSNAMKISWIDVDYPYSNGEYPIGPHFGVEVQSAGAAYDPVARKFYVFHSKPNNNPVIAVYDAPHAQPIRLVETIAQAPDLTVVNVLFARDEKIWIKTPFGYGVVNANTGEFIHKVNVSGLMNQWGTIAANPRAAITASAYDSILQIVTAPMEPNSWRVLRHQLPGTQQRDFTKIAVQPAGPRFLVGVRQPSNVDRQYYWSVYRGDIGDQMCRTPLGTSETSASVAPVCGNSILEEGEDCDDPGNQLCSVCRNPQCGNANVETGEECDDGNDVNFDGCSSCLMEYCSDDSESGPSHLQQGTLTYWFGVNGIRTSLQDRCENQTNIREFYCDADGKLQTTLIPCAGKSSYGNCGNAVCF